MIIHYIVYVIYIYYIIIYAIYIIYLLFVYGYQNEKVFEKNLFGFIALYLCQFTSIPTIYINYIYIYIMYITYIYIYIYIYRHSNEIILKYFDVLPSPVTNHFFFLYIHTTI